LRGFEVCGVGSRAYSAAEMAQRLQPRSTVSRNASNAVIGDSLGGEAISSILLSLSVPVPLGVRWPSDCFGSDL
jgi:hypothetical protein